LNLQETGVFLDNLYADTKTPVFDLICSVEDDISVRNYLGTSGSRRGYSTMDK